MSDWTKHPGIPTETVVGVGTIRHWKKEYRFWNGERKKLAKKLAALRAVQEQLDPDELDWKRTQDAIERSEFDLDRLARRCRDLERKACKSW